MAPTATSVVNQTPPVASPVITSTVAPTPTLIIPDLSHINQQIGIKLRVKAPGIFVNPLPPNDILRMKIAVRGGNSTPTIRTEYHNADFLSLGNGVFEGTVIFDTDTVPIGDQYKILVKGGKFLAKLFCSSNPTVAETSCASNNGTIRLQQGMNIFDFSQVTLPIADLPIADIQDGVLDAHDLSFIRRNLGSIENVILRIADINMDSVIDTQDYVMMMSDTHQNIDDQ